MRISGASTISENADAKLLVCYIDEAEDAAGVSSFSGLKLSRPEGLKEGASGLKTPDAQALTKPS